MMDLIRGLLILTSMLGHSLHAESVIGPQGHVGCRENPKQVDRLLITEPGVYENYLVDGRGKQGNLVKITVENVVLRHCEIRHGSGNAIGVFAPNVVIENCRIHHMLNGTFADQQDAHGISGKWGKLSIRNCDIGWMSGDCIQFDPDRASHGELTIEHCRLWTAPLPADSAGFKKGERPGENALDTKTPSDGPRSSVKLFRCLMHGFNQPAQIENVAALNLKESVDVEVRQCVFYDHEVAFRVRGPGQRGGAHVSIFDCAVYETRFAIRAEDSIEQLRLSGLAFGKDVGTRIVFVNGKPTKGYQTDGDHQAPDMRRLIDAGFANSP